MAHVLEIIGAQQRRAHERPPIEPCDLVDLVARNAAIARYAADAMIAVEGPPGGMRPMANRVIFSQGSATCSATRRRRSRRPGGGSGTNSVGVTSAGDRIRLPVCDDGRGSTWRRA